MEDSARYVGRAAYLELDSGLHAKLQFVTQGIADRYGALQLSVISRTRGEIDRVTVRFEDVWGRQAPYLVHRDADIGVCPADGLRLDALPEKFQTAWNDVLAAQVCWIRQGAYGPEIVLAGVDPQRVYDFSFMLIEEIDECPGQAPTPGLSME